MLKGGKGERATTGFIIFVCTKLTKIMYISNLAKCSITKRATFFFQPSPVDGMMGLFFCLLNFIM